jgi:phosphatidylglycerol:prolipoprotein diacylglycerol transferase
VPWAVIFNDPAAAPGTPLGVPLHPTQVYTSLLQFLLFVFLLWLLHRPHNDGEILGAWLFLSGLSSSLLTFLRGDGVVATQFIGAGMVLAGGILWLRRQPVAQASHGG